MRPAARKRPARPTADVFAPRHAPRADPPDRLTQALADVARAGGLDRAAVDERPLERLERVVEPVVVQVRRPFEVPLGEAPVQLLADLRERVDVLVLLGPRALPNLQGGGQILPAQRLSLVEVPARGGLD